MGVINKLNAYILIPTLGVTAGIITFIKPWPERGVGVKRDSETETQAFQRADVLHRLKPHMEKYTSNSDQYHITSQRKYVPSPHHDNHVGTSLLNKPHHIEIDPLVIRNKSVSPGDPEFENNVELTAYFHLGHELCNSSTGMVHKGVVALLMDELLCYAGFPKLPNGKGVTAKLEIEHLKDIPEDTTLVLNCTIKEAKGRKCEIEGVLSKVEDPSAKHSIQNWFGLKKSEPTVYAKGYCLLVEPKWFKYVTWINIFD